MPALNVGVRLESLGLPVRAAIEQAARLGAQGVRFDAVGELSPDQLSRTGRRHFGRLVASHGMRIVAVGAPSRCGFDVRDRLEARVSQTIKVLGLAGDLSAPIVVKQVGKAPTPTDEGRDDLFHESIDRVGREGDRVGVRFALDTGPDGPETLARFLDQSDLSGLAVHYNPANLLVAGHDIYDGVRILANHLAAVAVKDVTRTGETVSGYRETALGEGEIDWEVLLGALEEIAFRGFCIVSRDVVTRPLEDVAKALDYLSGR